MSKEQALQPKYAVGSKVIYTDRHGRVQTGVVRDIQGNWRGYRAGPSLQYRLSHPSYAYGQYYCTEESITGQAKND